MNDDTIFEIIRLAHTLILVLTVAMFNYVWYATIGVIPEFASFVLGSCAVFANLVLIASIGISVHEHCGDIIGNWIKVD